jgi:acetyl esterase/lipase
MRRFGQCVVMAVAGAILGLGGSHRVAQADGRPAASGKPDALVLPEIVYDDARGVDPHYHRLDLYMPHGKKGVPVMLFLHGGSWKRGDKNYFGLNKNLALLCARHQIGVALANYRLSPTAKHPEHIKDVARAFAWLHRNIGRYGGDPDRLFVSGHSAGAHLAALLATDASYLKAEGLSPANVRGVITLSGVFQIPDQNALFDHAFGTDVKVRRAASPTWQVSHWSPVTAKKAPPFLVMYADGDFTSCGKEPAEEFARVLRAKGGTVKVLEIPHRNHLTILVNASGETDPAGRTLIEFIHDRCRDRPPATENGNGT